MTSVMYVSPAEAVKHVKSGDTIVVQGSTSIPTVLLNALTERAAELRDVKIISLCLIRCAKLCVKDWQIPFLAS